MAKKVVRKVLGPNGQSMMKTFVIGKEKSKSQEEPTMKKPEQNLEVNTEPSTAKEEDKEPVAKLTVEMVKAMEPQELRVIADELNLKLGNVKKKEKMQAKVIELLKLEDDVEL